MGDGCEAATWNLVWCGGQLIGGQIPKFLLVLILPPPLSSGRRAAAACCWGWWLLDTGL